MGERLRLLHLIGGRGPGGSEKFYLRLVRALHQRDDVEVLPIVGKDSWLAARLKEEGLPHHELPFGSFFDFKTRPQIVEVISKFKPHVAQVWGKVASRFMPRDIVPTVARVSGYYSLSPYKKIDHMVGNTEDICRYVREKKWDANRVHYIPSFVDMPREDYRDHRYDVRAEYGISQSAKVMLMVGRLHEVKGFDAALFALTQLPENVHCILAGDGPDFAALKAAVEADGVAHRVHFTGWVNQVSPLFAAADVFVVPARHAHSGNVVLDGWAHAVPVAATDSAGPKSLIKDGEDGILVPVDDDKAMAKAIEHILANPDLAEAMAQAGYARVQTQFSEAQVVDQYVALYRDLLKG